MGAHKANTWGVLRPRFLDADWGAILGNLHRKGDTESPTLTLWNPALWTKSINECRYQLLTSVGLLVAFAWVFVWLASLFDVGPLRTILNLLPGFVQPLVGVPLAELATPAGRASVIYVDVITLLICIGWAIGRGSSVVSGDIARGTMELVLTLPVRRYTVIVVPAIVAALGSAILALSVWFGTWLGLVTVGWHREASIWQFLPGVINLFAMTFCLTGITTFLSSWDHDRWRTIWLGGGLFIVATMFKMVARLWPPGEWLKYLSFLTAFEPQQLILMEDAWSRSLWLSGVLVGLGLLSYLVAIVVFTWRDIPVPR
jgi:ABC-2 type transport system permease protein